MGSTHHEGAFTQPPTPGPPHITFSLLSIPEFSCLFAEGVFNPLWLRNHPPLPGYFFILGDGRASQRGEIGNSEQLIKTHLPFSSACRGVRNLSSLGTAIAGCLPPVQRHSHPLCICMCACTCMHTHAQGAAGCVWEPCRSFGCFRARCPFPLFFLLQGPHHVLWLPQAVPGHQHFGRVMPAPSSEGQWHSSQACPVQLTWDRRTDRQTRFPSRHPPHLALHCPSALS